MNRPAVFFDRDNTLIIGNDYLGDPAKVVLVDGASDAVARARALGYAVVVVSNQSGVARGMFGEDDVHAVNERMNAMLLAENPDAIIDRHEFCPFHPQAPVPKYRVESDARKPRPGMLLKAAREMDLDLARSWMIGDAPRDVEAGHAAGCRTILFSDSSLPISPAAQAITRIEPEFVALSLKSAMDHIANSMLPVAAASASPVPTMPSPTAAFEDAPPGVPAEASIGVDLARPPFFQDAPMPGAAPEPRPDTPNADFARLSASTVAVPSGKLELLAEKILDELRRGREQTHMDFSVSKLLAGIVQVVAVALAFLAYLDRDNGRPDLLLFAAIFFQAMVSSLLIMSRQK